MNVTNTFFYKYTYINILHRYNYSIQYVREIYDTDNELYNLERMRSRSPSREINLLRYVIKI